MQPIKGGAAGVAAAAGTSTVNSPLAGGPAQGKDATESARNPQFGDVLKQMQAKYGEQPTKPREIKKTLGKDDFLKIMITQMKNQDPTNPFKAEQMATEIAQFTSVEQLQNVNQNLNKMANQNRPLEQMAMTNMIGKMVTVDRERFPHVEGQSDTLNFNLPKNGTSVKVSIVNEAGETVFQKDLGHQKAGEVSLSWDGTKINSLPAKSGNYLYRVDALDDRGLAIGINPKVRSKVIGVSFEGAEPVFLVGDAKHQDKVTFKNISQIEVDSSNEPPRALPPRPEQSASSVPTVPTAASSPVPGAPEAEALPAPDSAQSSNYFTFKKGVGSQPLVAQEEKGFPNGLGEASDAPPEKVPEKVQEGVLR